MRRLVDAGLILILALSIVIRIVLALSTDLAPDEAYYWTWSRHLAWGYFDHPPLIAWLIRLGTLFAGDTVSAVRLLPLLLGGLTLLGFFFAARLLSIPMRAALLLVAAAAWSPLAMAGGFLATPDAPLVAAWVWALAFSIKALKTDKAWWCYAAGAAMGLGLLAKLSMMLFPISIAMGGMVWFILGRKSPHPCPFPRGLLLHGLLGMGLGLIIWLPNVLWTATHEWSTLRFQLGHALLPGAEGWSTHHAVDLVGAYVGAQIGLLTPLAAWWWLESVAAPPSPDDRASLLLWFTSLLPLGLGLVASFVVYQEPNWAAVGHPAALLIAGAYLAKAWDRADARRKTSVLRNAALASLVMVIFGAIPASHVLHPWLPLPAAKDPTSRLHGWAQLSQERGEEKPVPSEGGGVPKAWRDTSDSRGSQELEQGQKVTKYVGVLADTYGLAAEMAFYLKDHALPVASPDRPWPLLPAGNWLLVREAETGNMGRIEYRLTRIEKRCVKTTDLQTLELRRNDGAVLRRIDMLSGEGCGEKARP